MDLLQVKDDANFGSDAEKLVCAVQGLLDYIKRRCPRHGVGIGKHSSDPIVVCFCDEAQEIIKRI